MKRKWMMVVVMVGALLALTSLLGLVQQPSLAAAQVGEDTAVPATAVQPFAIRTSTVCTGTNLLQNPGFEGEYTAYQYPPPGHPDCQTWYPDQPNQYCERAQMPAEWHPRWLPDGTELYIIMPEYTASTPDQVNPDRVRSGEKSLHYWSFWSRHESAVHQQVTAVPGEQFCFSVWGHAWSDRNSDDWYSATPDRPFDDGQLFQKVGIDPTGGTDWQSPTVIWSEPRKQYDYFGEFVITATAQAEQVTVFMWSRAEVPVKHNEVYWDDAFLSAATLDVDGSSIAAMATVTTPITVSQVFPINLTAGYTWTAVITPGNTITPTLTPTTGVGGDALTVTLSSAGLMTGTYTAMLVVSTDDGVIGSPATIQATLYVVPQIEYVYLPVVLKP
ncbi:MAG: hypothetical protein H6664_00365 [Ardenticatenaceae bacterium]|nr:hypothetical protein [Ardenticatenaceae bacterium]MCB9002795.1 hypothetical protein [Ardenticatenaceae bacterium]